MKALKTAAGATNVAATLVTLITVAPTVLASYGIDVGPFLGWFVGSSPWLLPTSCLLLGFALGSSFGWRVRGTVDVKGAQAKPRRMSRKERRALEERCRKDAEESWNAAADAIMQLSPEDRALLVVLGRGEAAYGRGADWRYSAIPTSDFCRQLFSMSFMDNDLARITATPLLGQLFDRCPWLTEGVPDTMRRHLMPTARSGMTYTMSSYDNMLPYWWWTNEEAFAKAEAERVAAEKTELDKLAERVLRYPYEAKSLLYRAATDMAVDVGKEEHRFAMFLSQDDLIESMGVWSDDGRTWKLTERGEELVSAGNYPEVWAAIQHAGGTSE